MLALMWSKRRDWFGVTISNMVMLIRHNVEYKEVEAHRADLGKHAILTLLFLANHRNAGATFFEKYVLLVLIMRISLEYNRYDASEPPVFTLFSRSQIYSCDRRTI
jgi:hypothetical protein